MAAGRVTRSRTSVRIRKRVRIFVGVNNQAILDPPVAEAVTALGYDRKRFGPSGPAGHQEIEERVETFVTVRNGELLLFKAGQADRIYRVLRVMGYPVDYVDQREADARMTVS